MTRDQQGLPRQGEALVRAAEELLRGRGVERWSYEEFAEALDEVAGTSQLQPRARARPSRTSQQEDSIAVLAEFLARHDGLPVAEAYIEAERRLSMTRVR